MLLDGAVSNSERFIGWVVMGFVIYGLYQIADSDLNETLRALIVCLGAPLVLCIGMIFDLMGDRTEKKLRENENRLKGR
jgi:hypothetical protein